ncbi:POLR2B [Cordylochernes scorpioides]|uniref:DNA-directed RNA polymerase n=1 Tax=Cordylochernes scorpioides TaxID=51811 RepID=A0ABY6KZQ4_9ARAC|nr:POLR2B [Cordylochernes scorpioides]
MEMEEFLLVYMVDEVDLGYNRRGLTQMAAWNVIDAYFAQRGMVQHQIESFDHFVQESLQRIVLDLPPIVAESDPQYLDGAPRAPDKVTITFGQVYISKPIYRNEALTPNIARLRGLTYAAPLFVDITILVEK